MPPLGRARNRVGGCCSGACGGFLIALRRVHMALSRFCPPGGSSGSPQSDSRAVSSRAEILTAPSARMEY